ncbi:MAG TPA: FG-GAP-like repeat-containing protein [Gemmataceae bacterium]
MIPVVVVVLAAVGVGGFLAWKWYTRLPERGSPKYVKYVAAFQVGVAVVDLGAADNTKDPAKAKDDEIGNLALSKLTEAIDTIPQEPAAWANRGLWYLRKSQFPEATRDLKQAEKLAPESVEIQRLLGWLARQKGDFSEAVKYFQKALGKDPNDLQTLYMLAETIQQENEPRADQEYLTLMNRGLEIRPNNFRLLRQKAKKAAKLGDRDALDGVIATYKRLAPTWSGDHAEEARTELAKLERESRGPLPADVDATITGLDYVLMPEGKYFRDAKEVDPAQDNIGESLQQFLRLDPMRASPSPPDLALDFAAATPPAEVAAAVKSERWDVALPVWLTQDQDPVLFVANAHAVRQAVGDYPALPFPGGAGGMAPSPSGVLAVDWNNDYRTGLLFAGAGGLRLFRQNEDGQFLDVDGKTKLDAETLGADYFGAWAADIEMDGDLDFIVAPRAGAPFVLRNNGDGTFQVVKCFSGVEGARAFVWADFDNDGAPDAAFLDAKGQLHVFANERAGIFRKWPTPDGLGKCLALAAADVTDDGVFDLLVLRDDGAVLRLSDKEKGKGWEVAELARWTDFPGGAEPGSFRLFVEDLDNNGALDLIVTGPQGTRIWLGDEHGKFSPLSIAMSESVFGVADLNADGRLDLLALSDAGQPVQRLSRGAKDYHWQVIRPLAEDRRKVEVQRNNRVNSYGLGGEIEIRSGLLVQKQRITGPVVHFGLGEQPKAAVARIQWPNGLFQAEFDVMANKTTSVPQRIHGSCPFLYTFDGSGMQFVCDFMWSTPLGMYINAQDKGGFLQTEEWIKIRGDQLVPRDGYYDVRVGANLWETHFFDHVALIVVDHPEYTEMHVDERFAVTPMKPQVYLTKPSRPVAHAWDDHGKDVTELVRAVDGKYLDTFEPGLFQGVARDHYVEVDLGDDAPKEGPLWLLAYGWVQPTDSSLNVAIEQGSHERPHALVLEIPDDKGGWKTARNDIGFPAGKNKTVMIRLDGIDGRPGVTRRFRLRTNMEIYWDALHYAEGLDAGQARQQHLLPHTAELRHRGVVQMSRANNSSPEIPHYDTLVSTSQYWRDLIGWYTRYGDVRELLAKVDDRYVIMNAGDELALRFAVPEGPPAGWKRDFVWISDGWVKDGNYNTRFSKTVLPLPAHDLSTYDKPPGRLKDDPVYQRFPEDWKKYHTRYVTPDVYEQGLRNFRRPKQ